MVLGYHIVCTAYGFWLPNDPRRSWSATALVGCHNMEAPDERAGARRIPFSGPARGALSAAHVMSNSIAQAHPQPTTSNQQRFEQYYDKYHNPRKVCHFEAFRATPARKYRNGIDL